MGWVRGLVGFQLIGLLVCSMCCDAKGFSDGGEKLKLISPRPAPTPPPPSLVKLSVAVEGVVYCMSCKLPGFVASINASPLKGVIASLVCSVGKQKTSVKGNSTTDSHGYFLISVQNVKPSALISTCKVVLKLPLWCNRRPVYVKKVSQSQSTTAPTSTSTSTRVIVPFKYERTNKVGSSVSILYTAGFSEFAPAKISMCPRRR